MIAASTVTESDLNGLLSASRVARRRLLAQPDGPCGPDSFSPRALKVEISALSKVKLPAVLHWNLNHSLVLRASREGLP
jgi:ATP-binding cassette subfamily B protein RaxB